MKLGILKCDCVSALLSVTHGQYPDMFDAFLRPMLPSLELTIYDAEHGQLPIDTDEVDAYLITGSRHSVYDGYPWIDQLEAFIRALHQKQKKLIGICFGHQLIAKALGGRVIKSPKGWGVGVSHNKILLHKSWMEGAMPSFNVLVSHQDQVVTLPKDAQVLAGNEFCPYQMMQIGGHVLTIQGHPEFSKAYSKALMVTREDTLSEEEFRTGIDSLTQSIDHQLIATWFRNFLQAAPIYSVPCAPKN